MKKQNSVDFCLTSQFYFGYNANIIQEQTKSQRTTCGIKNLHIPLHIVEKRRAMKILEDRILRDGKVKPGNVLKVGGFLGHLIDQQVLDEIGKEISALFCASVFLNTHPSFFAQLIHKFHDPIFFKTLDSDMQYKYNAISVETT